MKRIRTICVWAVGMVLIAAAGIWGYGAYFVTRDLSGLMTCSLGHEYLYPKALCIMYLKTVARTPEEIDDFSRNGGVESALSSSDEQERSQLLDLLLAQGLDIDARDDRAGITALHVAVLNNNIDTVMLLLNKGASSTVRDRDRGQTPLEFALVRQGKPNQPDRSTLIRLLQERASVTEK